MNLVAIQTEAGGPQLHGSKCTRSTVFGPQSSVMTEDRRTVDRGLRTVDCGLWTDAPTRRSVVWYRTGASSALFNVLMIMRRIVLESSTIKKRMLIS